MFIIDLHYIAPLEKLDEHMAVHVKFLQTYYKKIFLLPPDGRCLAPEELFLHWPSQGMKLILL